LFVPDDAVHLNARARRRKERREEDEDSESRHFTPRRTSSPETIRLPNRSDAESYLAATATGTAAKARPAFFPGAAGSGFLPGGGAGAAVFTDAPPGRSSAS